MLSVRRSNHSARSHTDKKRKENSPHILGNSEGPAAKSYMTNDLLIYGKNICAFPHILGRPSSYMTLHPIHLHFLIYEEKFVFFFISATTGKWASTKSFKICNKFMSALFSCWTVYTVKKRLAIFPSPAGMSLTRRLGTGKSLTFFYSVPNHHVLCCSNLASRWNGFIYISFHASLPCGLLHFLCMYMPMYLQDM